MDDWACNWPINKLYNYFVNSICIPICGVFDGDRDGDDTWSTVLIIEVAVRFEFGFGVYPLEAVWSVEWSLLFVGCIILPMMDASRWNESLACIAVPASSDKNNRAISLSPFSS